MQHSRLALDSNQQSKQTQLLRPEYEFTIPESNNVYLSRKNEALHFLRILPASAKHDRSLINDHLFPQDSNTSSSTSSNPCHIKAPNSRHNHDDEQWNPPFLSFGMGPSQVANSIAKQMHTRFSKVSFSALVKAACGLQTDQTDEVTSLLDSVNHARLELCSRFNMLPELKEGYQAVERELKAQSPLAYWLVSTSIWLTNESLEPSDALAGIFIPIRDIFENHKLPFISMLHCLQHLAILHQEILSGDDQGWAKFSAADSSLIAMIINLGPLETAKLLTEADISHFRCFRPRDVSCSQEESSLPEMEMGNKWSSLVENVKLCATAHPGLVNRIGKTAKHLIDGRNFFSGMAFLLGLDGTEHPPVELSKYWELLTIDDNYASYRKSWSTAFGLPFLFPHMKMIRTTQSYDHKQKIIRELFQFVKFTRLYVSIGVDPENEASLDIC